MAIRKIRIHSSVSLDEATEGDLINILEELNSQHKTGEFLSCLMRLAVDSPEILKSSKDNVNKLNNLLSESGLSQERFKYIRVVKEGMLYLEAKINKLYEMTEQLMALAIMGKRLGLEGKAENLARVNFLLEQQLKDLEKAIGYKSDDIKAVDIEKNVERAEKTLEFIVTAYDDIIQEIKNSLTANVVPIVMNPDSISTVQQAINNPIETAVKEEVTPSVIPQADENEEIDFGAGSNESLSENTSTSEDSPIDFGDADFAALGNFFG